MRSLEPSHSPTLAYLQVLRLPNVFTAIADVSMGFLVTHVANRPIVPFVLLVVVSASLYLAGMVLNDVFDLDEDTRDRPERPIPSGRVSLFGARILGWTLVAAGVIAAWLSSSAAETPRPGIVGSLLALAVVLYDGQLKETTIGPLVMGACRSLNVLLGMSLVALEPWHVVAALGIGIYVVGLTLFARTEAVRSESKALTQATIVMMSGLGIVASLPAVNGTPSLTVAFQGWFMLWLLIALVILRRCALAITRPEPRRVQAAVRNAIMSLVVIDAAVTLGMVGIFWGCAVLLLMAPMLALAQFINPT